jgi:glycolate oxidase iron-sulfur subunit
LTFKREYPKLLRPGDEAPSFLDIHEVLAKAALDLALSRLCSRITWHDPCHLTRGQDLGKKARDVLRLIPGVTLVEMENPDRCCGFGGVMRIRQYPLSDAIAAHKVKSIVRTSAEAVITGCPSCRMQIREGLSRTESDIKAFHTVQVVAAALAGVESEMRSESRRPGPVNGRG